MARYDTSVNIDYFRGLNQTGSGHNTVMRYATEIENVNVDGGTFRSMRMGKKLDQELDAPIETLTYLHRRFGSNEETGTLMVAISSGKVYTKLLDGLDEWELRYPLNEETELTSSRCSCVTYEVNIRDGEALETPVDILLFTNAYDGMFCLYGDTKQIVPVSTPYKFGVLARYNERIWGTGIIGEPDLLVYSGPYDPFYWSDEEEPVESEQESAEQEQNPVSDDEEQEIQPEDMPGEISQPTWDGDSFQALIQYGSELLAVKRNSMWRIFGTNPGEFIIQKQYGGGTVVGGSLTVYSDKAYMLGERGILRYDGTGTFPFMQEELHTLFHERVNTAAMQFSTAAMRNGVYCLSLPLDGSDHCNAILEYNVSEGTVTLRTGISVDHFMQLDERLFYTSESSPGRVFEMDDDYGAVLPCIWISGWQDANEKQSVKNVFLLYMMVNSEAPVEMRIGIRTEKKYKQKIISTKPGKMTRLRLNTHGRMFRLEIRTYGSVPFTIGGGIRLDMELDPD